ncbi:bacillithiol biosynthesis cysteine-adding enzyme BshC [Candidatus Palauibacter sp.]|uniref:bacillithiol biosynthesis cysteine-adding enzyme BshC n=1 Tax=Candidatus Palauibacter sp. TaxID=3101350 RepID=UPI003B02E21F
MTRAPSHRTLDIRPRPLAAPGSLAEAVLRGDGPNSLPLVSGADLANLLPPRQARLGPESFGISGDRVRGRLDAVLRGEGCFVSTGHQPILLLGPLYVLYKTLTAISLARYVERAIGQPVLPLFWIAADDHDWEEVGRSTLLDRTDEPQSLVLPVPEGGGRRSVGPQPLADTLLETLDELDQILPSSEFTSHYLTLLRGAYREGQSVSQAFASLLHAVLGDRDYVWIDAGQATVKRAATPLYARLLGRWKDAAEAEAVGARELAAAGFDPSIAPMPGALPLFFDSGQGRQRVGRENDEEGSVQAWRARLESAPEGFSPNVASRPVLESYLLPVAATVLGPGEIAYWSQLRPLFELLGVPVPPAHPRAAWTLVEPRIQRLLDRVSLSPEDLATGAEAVATRLTREARPASVDAALTRFREAAEHGLAEVEQAVAEELPGLRAAVGKARKRVLDTAGDLSRHVDRETRQRLDTRLGQIRRAAANLYPGRRPQERVLNPFPYLCRYGPEFVDHLGRTTDEWVASSLAGTEADG